MRLLLSIILATIFFGGWNLMAIDQHPFDATDLNTLERISGPAVSPDGKRIVFSVRRTDMDANKGRTDLWIINMDGTGLTRLTEDDFSESDATWSPDGNYIYFISNRTKSSQVWRLPVAGGEATQATHLPLDAANFKISPDGGKIAVSMEVFPGKSPKETAAKLEELEKVKASGRIYDRLFFRHWDTWMDGRRSHIFVMPSEGGEPVDVMKEMDADSPLKPFGGSEEFTFTPDSKGIVFTAKDLGREEAWSTNADLFYAPADASAAPKNLTSENKAWDTTPVFSPDGKTLAYLAMKNPGFEADRFYIKLRPWPEGPVTTLAESWDRSAASIAFAPSGKSLYVSADNLGQKSLFEIDVKKGTVKTVILEGSVAAFIPLAKQVVYALDTLKSPVEIFSLDLKTKIPKQLTFISKDKLAACKLGEYEQFSFTGANNEKVYAFVMKPVDFDANKKYPVAMLIHGGPQGSFGNHFHYRWNPQPYAGRGYASIMVDFHGSTGYGQAFTDSISGDWGGKPLEDLQKGLAAALEKYPWMDGERVAALGASYGGYMINWIAGNWPDRFRCLVCHDGNLDERLAYFDTEELWFPEWDHQGTPWSNPEGYAKHNPIEFVKNWKTPMLVIHGGLDFRVVDTQGMSTFTALQRLGVPSKFLYFPDENHWVLKPHNSILWHNTVLDWLDQWCKK